MFINTNFLMGPISMDPCKYLLGLLHGAKVLGGKQIEHLGPHS